MDHGLRPRQREFFIGFTKGEVCIIFSSFFFYSVKFHSFNCIASYLGIIGII